MAIKLSVKHSKVNTNSRLEKMLEKHHLGVLDKYGKMGVEALAAATPKDTGKTAESWSYEIIRTPNFVKLVWSNSSTTYDGIPIVVLLHYGHATGSGGYVEGRDFINPALKPIMDDLVKKVWKGVTEA